MTEELIPPWEAEEEVRYPVSAKARELADSLFSEIAAGVHGFGTRLPAERVLSESRGLSRSTVRQAFGLMENFGIIRRRAGSGAVVCFRPQPVFEQDASRTDSSRMLDLAEIGATTSPLELGVVRSIIEPEIARLAVLNMTARDIEAIRAIQTEIEEVTVDGEKFATLNDAFWMQLAIGTHNPLVVAIYAMINRVSRDATWSVQRRWRLSPARIRECTLQNRSLCEAIEGRDIEAAVEFVRLMLADANQDLMPGI